MKDNGISFQVIKFGKFVLSILKFDSCYNVAPTFFQHMAIIKNNVTWYQGEVHPYNSISKYIRYLILSYIILHPNPIILNPTYTYL